MDLAPIVLRVSGPPRDTEAGCGAYANINVPAQLIRGELSTISPIASA